MTYTDESALSCSLHRWMSAPPQQLSKNLTRIKRNVLLRSLGVCVMWLLCIAPTALRMFLEVDMALSWYEMIMPVCAFAAYFFLTRVSVAHRVPWISIRRYGHHTHRMSSFEHCTAWCGMRCVVRAAPSQSHCAPLPSRVTTERRGKSNPCRVASFGFPRMKTRCSPCGLSCVDPTAAQADLAFTATYWCRWLLASNSFSHMLSSCFWPSPTRCFQLCIGCGSMAQASNPSTGRLPFFLLWVPWFSGSPLPWISLSSP